MIEIAVVILRKSMTVTIHKSAFALNSQESDLLITIEASLPIFLLLLDWLQRKFLYLVSYFPLNVGKRS